MISGLTTESLKPYTLTLSGPFKTLAEPSQAHTHALCNRKVLRHRKDLASHLWKERDWKGAGALQLRDRGSVYFCGFGFGLTPVCRV